MAHSYEKTSTDLAQPASVKKFVRPDDPHLLGKLSPASIYLPSRTWFQTPSTVSEPHPLTSGSSVTC